jgi:hypothetical protein
MANIESYVRPKHLYRFRRVGDLSELNREIKAINKAYLWCSKYSEMNDPMEGIHRAKRTLLTKGNTDFDEIEAAGQNLGICSFTEKWDHEVMWAHYANGFCGICISYDFDKLLKNLPENHMFTQVSYHERPVAIRKPLLRDQRVSNEEKAKVILSTKSHRWLYEREWRLFSPATGEAEYKNKSCVDQVFLGVRVSEKLKKTLESALGSDLKVTHTEVKKFSFQLTTKAGAKKHQG